MSLCNAKLAAETNVLLSAILEAISSQGDLLNDQALLLGNACFKTDAGALELTPAVTIVDGFVKSTIYFKQDGTQYIGAVSPTDPCDCPCHSGCSEVKACLYVDLFDVDRGLLQAGETTSFEIQSSSGTVTVVHDYVTSSDAVNVSSFYTPIMAEINSRAGWSIEVVKDVGVADTGKPTYRLSHEGNVADTMKIVKTPNGDVYEFVSDGAGSLTGTALDNGQPFGSDPFDHPDCKDGVPYPDISVNGSWKTTGHLPDMMSLTAFEYQGDNSGQPPAGSGGATYAEYLAYLTADGYVVTQQAIAGNGITIVSDPLGTGLPSMAKVETPTNTVAVNWTAV